MNDARGDSVRICTVRKLERTSKRVGQVQDEVEVDAQLKDLSKIIEPVVILIVGGAVVFMILAVLLPIMQMNEMAGK